MKQMIRKVVGADRIASIRRSTEPLRLAALEQAMRRKGWSYADFQMTDEQAATHFANEREMDRFGRGVARFFQQYKIDFLTKTLDRDFVAKSDFVEIGDSDGLLLKALGKSGVSITDDPRCARQIEENGVQATVGKGEGIDLPTKSKDVAMSFETLEHSLNPAAFLAEMARVARKKVIVSIPGVTRTIIHPRIKGMRVGEEHVFEFCKDDFIRLTTHLPLKLSLHHKMPVFASPRGPVSWLFYQMHRNRELFAGCFRAFDFYIFDVVDDDQGVDARSSLELY